MGRAFLDVEMSGKLSYWSIIWGATLPSKLTNCDVFVAPLSASDDREQPEISAIHYMLWQSFWPELLQN